MKIFISYSTSDLNLVNKIADQIRPFAEVFFWDKSKMPGEEVWPTIFSWIDNADLVMAIITGNTLSRAMAVGQEIGRAKAKGKHIVPLVSREVPSTELGFLSGITYQPVDPYNSDHAMQDIKSLVMGKKKKIEDDQTLFAVGGIALLFLALITSEK